MDFLWDPLEFNICHVAPYEYAGSDSEAEGQYPGSQNLFCGYMFVFLTTPVDFHASL